MLEELTQGGFIGQESNKLLIGQSADFEFVVFGIGVSDSQQRFNHCSTKFIITLFMHEIQEMKVALAEIKLASLQRQLGKINSGYAESIKELRKELLLKDQKQNRLKIELEELRKEYAEHQQKIREAIDSINQEESTRKSVPFQDKRRSGPKLLIKAVSSTQSSKLSPTQRSIGKNSNCLSSPLKKKQSSQVEEKMLANEGTKGESIPSKEPRKGFQFLKKKSFDEGNHLRLGVQTNSKIRLSFQFCNSLKVKGTISAKNLRISEKMSLNPEQNKK